MSSRAGRPGAGTGMNILYILSIDGLQENFRAISK